MFSHALEPKREIIIPRPAQHRALNWGGRQLTAAVAQVAIYSLFGLRGLPGGMLLEEGERQMSGIA
jgi:hypothetical protein